MTWCDRFKPIAGVPQIVGHTYHKNVQWAGFERLGDSEFNFGHCVAGSLEEDERSSFALGDEVSFCLDTGLRHYAVQTRQLVVKAGLLPIRQEKLEWISGERISFN